MQSCLKCQPINKKHHATSCSATRFEWFKNIFVNKQRRLLAKEAASTRSIDETNTVIYSLCPTFSWMAQPGGKNQIRFVIEAVPKESKSPKEWHTSASSWCLPNHRPNCQVFDSFFIMIMRSSFRTRPFLISLMSNGLQRNQNIQAMRDFRNLCNSI